MYASPVLSRKAMIAVQQTWRIIAIFSTPALAIAFALALVLVFVFVLGLGLAFTL